MWQAADVKTWNGKMYVLVEKKKKNSGYSWKSVHRTAFGIPFLVQIWTTENVEITEAVFTEPYPDTPLHFCILLKEEEDMMVLVSFIVQAILAMTQYFRKAAPLFQWDDEQIWSSTHSCSRNVQSLLRSSGWAASSWTGGQGRESAPLQNWAITLQQYKRDCWEWRTCTKRHRISGQGRCTSVYVQDESESISLPPPLKALSFTKANSLCKEMQSASFLLSYILCAAAVKQMFNIAF